MSASELEIRVLGSYTALISKPIYFHLSYSAKPTPWDLCYTVTSPFLFNSLYAGEWEPTLVLT